LGGFGSARSPGTAFGFLGVEGASGAIDAGAGFDLATFIVGFTIDADGPTTTSGGTPRLVRDGLTTGSGTTSDTTGVAGFRTALEAGAGAFGDAIRGFGSFGSGASTSFAFRTRELVGRTAAWEPVRDSAFTGFTSDRTLATVAFDLVDALAGAGVAVATVATPWARAIGAGFAAGSSLGVLTLGATLTGSAWA
jgi:hypothetical protein